MISFSIVLSILFIVCSYFFFWLALTFSFWRQKEKGNKKKNRRLQFRTGCEAPLVGSAGTRFAQTACASFRRALLLRFSVRN